ncbi:MAG: ATP-grasp domain-containing protein [Planctomycetaceae bacterium]
MIRVEVEERGLAGSELLIVGTSARAAAFSALRAGLSPICVDQFADRDLLAVSPTTQLECIVQDLPAIMQQFAGMPILYTGGLENHPETLALLEQFGPLLGNRPDVIRQVRDPQRICEAIKAVKMPYLEVLDQDSPPPPDGTWLLKPLRSGGGRGIVVWDERAVDSPTLQEPHYFQQYAQGTPCSAVFIARDTIGDVRFVGLTEQLIGESALNAEPFQWCGNVGPVGLSLPAESGIRRLGNFFKWKFKLKGLFGLDFLVDGDTVWLTEVNPRYPASLEILEFATGQALLADHCDCFEGIISVLQMPHWTPSPEPALAKGVLFAERSSQVNIKVPISGDGFRTWPRMADVPPAGSHIQRATPLCSLFATGTSTQMSKENLFSFANSLQSR